MFQLLCLRNLLIILEILMLKSWAKEKHSYFPIALGISLLRSLTLQQDLLIFLLLYSICWTWWSHYLARSFYKITRAYRVRGLKASVCGVARDLFIFGPILICGARPASESLLTDLRWNRYYTRVPYNRRHRRRGEKNYTFRDTRTLRKLKIMFDKC